MAMHGQTHIKLIRGLVYLAFIQFLISYRQEKGKGM